MMSYRKYNNRPTTIDGIRFDSKAEAARYRELAILARAGEIEELELQPSFTLVPAFRDAAGRKHRAVTYTADFAYTVDGQRVVEDVKGGRATKTQAFRIKWKLAIRQNPSLCFVTVEA